MLVQPMERQLCYRHIVTMIAAFYCSTVLLLSHNPIAAHIPVCLANPLSFATVHLLQSYRPSSNRTMMLIRCRSLHVPKQDSTPIFQFHQQDVVISSFLLHILIVNMASYDPNDPNDPNRSLKKPSRGELPNSHDPYSRKGKKPRKSRFTELFDPQDRGVPAPDASSRETSGPESSSLEDAEIIVAHNILREGLSKLHALERAEQDARERSVSANDTTEANLGNQTSSHDQGSGHSAADVQHGDQAREGRETTGLPDVEEECEVEEGEIVEEKDGDEDTHNAGSSYQREAMRRMEIEQGRSSQGRGGGRT